MATIPTEKNTKAEILAAYNEVCAKLKQQKVQDVKEEKKKTEEQKVVQKAGELSVENIIKNIGNTKLDILNALDDLSEKLLPEFRKLSDLKAAIEIETKNLHELYEIKVNIESLGALLLAQSEKKAAFEIEMGRKKAELDEDIFQKRLTWKTEQDNFESAKKERDLQLKKDRQREEEEYSYNLGLKRKKENDVYIENKARLEKELEEKKSVFEKDYSEREAAILARENEYAELKNKVDRFPVQLEKALQENEAKITAQLELTYKHQSELVKREMESEKKLNQQTISLLQAKIKEQEEQLKQLSLKANEYSSQVQTIAIKAIEGASTQRIIYPTPEKEK
jgi:hypothetical protein